MKHTYLFTSERLGFRNWDEQDIEPMMLINTDEEVMEFFPATQGLDRTIFFVEREQKEYEESGHCYFAVDRLEDGAFIGFIGLSEWNMEAGYAPGIDLGWRLAKAAWGNGYATEGARRCLEYAFNELGKSEVFAICPIANKRSEAVMLKIGMELQETFDHPLLLKNERLRRCVLYRVSNKAAEV